MRDDEPPATTPRGPPVLDAPDEFSAVLAEVAELTIALSTALTDVAFAEAVRTRDALAGALYRGKRILEGPSNPEKQTTTTQQFHEMWGVAIRLLQVAPAPCPSAIAAAESGDFALLNREEQAWIADRLASGTNPRIPRPRRERRDTQPDTPSALRRAGKDNETTAVELTTSSESRSREENGTR